jgi:3'-phosphoadenosine 5'-phosphosulfate sulfotransferase (PAPS reductase)/FAD synthetase
LKIGLAFSGGKDSLACLMLNREKLDEITVFWVNNGKNYPELLETVGKVRQICKNFVEVSVSRQKQNEMFGIPSDVVPINWTKLGQELTSSKPVMIQSYLECCFANISAPLNEAIAAHGITHLIAGQRNEETHKSTTKHGDVVNGVTRIHPIENWTKKQVMDYLATVMDIPDHLHLEHSSMDCYDCTAYRKESKDRVRFTKKVHPELYAEYKVRSDALKTALKDANHATCK